MGQFVEDGEDSVLLPGLSRPSLYGRTPGLGNDEGNECGRTSKTGYYFQSDQCVRDFFLYSTGLMPVCFRKAE